MTGKALAAAAGAVAGYVYNQRQQGAAPDFGTNPQDLVAPAPLANVAAATLAALVTRSGLAGFLLGFALSAFGGNKLNELVASQVQQRKNPEPQPLTEAA